MDQTSYYEKNSKLHGQQTEVSKVFALKHLPKNPSEVDWAIFWLDQENKQGTCIDIGCGQLTFLRSVEGMFEKRYGIDIAVHDNWANHPEIITQKWNLDEGPLRFPDQSFDAVVMLMVLEHVFNPFHAVRELRRICKPDGYVVIGVPNIAGLRHRLTLFLGRLPVTAARFAFQEESWDGYHLHNFTQASLAWVLRRNGLEPIKWASSGNLQEIKRLRPRLFGGDLIVLCRPSEPVPTLPPSF